MCFAPATNVVGIVRAPPSELHDLVGNRLDVKLEFVVDDTQGSQTSFLLGAMKRTPLGFTKRFSCRMQNCASFVANATVLTLEGFPLDYCATTRRSFMY